MVFGYFFHLGFVFQYTSTALFKILDQIGQLARRLSNEFCCGWYENIENDLNGSEKYMNRKNHKKRPIEIVRL